MTHATTLVEGYIETWNEHDPLRRRALVSQTFAGDADYVDPLMESEGHDGIEAMIAGAQEQYADYRFELAGGPDEHHGRVRFTWRLVAAGTSEPVAIGHDFGTLAGDGRLQSVTGFLETPGS
ncbi:MAG: nuclear transport factor 2 family protein [Solirubrobacteraceae bacterium]